MKQYLMPITASPRLGRFSACLMAGIGMLSCCSVALAADLVNLRCEYRDNPLGIDVAKPRLSWKIAAGDELYLNGKKVREVK